MPSWIDALLATCATDAEQFTLHGERLTEGHEEVRARFLTRLAEPNLHACLLSRNVVVDLELITRNFPECVGMVEMLCIYEVANGLIQKVSFAVDENDLAE